MTRLDCKDIETRLCGKDSIPLGKYFSKKKTWKYRFQSLIIVLKPQQIYSCAHRSVANVKFLTQATLF